LSVTYPPRFNGVVKAVENKNKGRNYTKIGNLDTVLGVAKGRVTVTDIADIINGIN